MVLDGNGVFQGSKFNVTMQKNENVVLFFVGVHCFAH